MRKGKKGLGKKENTAVAASARGFFFAFTLALCAVAAVVVGTANAATYTVCAIGCNYQTIQSAVNAATSGDTIFVYNGSYIENVNVGTAHLTLEGEGKDKVTVTAASSSDDVFEVTADWVNISGFTATGATSGDWIAGITLNGVQHCKISENNCSKNSLFGIYLQDSSNNELTNNTANQNDVGIELDSSSNNTLTSNTANQNDWVGIWLDDSSNNTLTSNTAANNWVGIELDDSSNNTLTSNTANYNNWDGIELGSSSNNTLTGNTANENNWDGIELYYSNYNTLTGNTANYNNDGGIELYYSNYNTLTSNTANYNNDDGIQLGSSSNNTLTSNTANYNNWDGIELYYSNYNTLTGNTANENNKQGIRLGNTDGNNISCNRVQANKQAGFRLSGGSTGNTIAQNNILVNGNYNAATEGYEWNFYNDQSDAVTAKNNYWGTTNATKIDASIYDNDENAGKGEVDFSGYKSGPVPCAPVPELPTVVLFSAGLLGVVGYFLLGQRRREKK
ncbi:MAG: right-handed parallel beta-helix repeat-containing protein [Methanophagales archaeon]|nr:right-handed parallel beta-helix repeat-containing protein [Methanophagales archaeon]